MKNCNASRTIKMTLLGLALLAIAVKVVHATLFAGLMHQGPLLVELSLSLLAVFAGGGILFVCYMLGEVLASCFFGSSRSTG